MNHFQLLFLPATYDLEPSVLESAYFALQRQYHPDRFIGKTAEERAKAASQSAAANEAYNTLKDPLKRAKHLLSLAGINVDQEKASPALLAEVMELQEEGGDVAALIAACEQALANAFKKGDVDSAKALTLRLSYLYKIVIPTKVGTQT